MSEMDPRIEIELEAAAFRRLLEHLRARTDVQNIDMMNLAGFCRNCLSNWYQEAGAERGLATDCGGNPAYRLSAFACDGPKAASVFILRIGFFLACSAAMLQPSILGKCALP